MATLERHDQGNTTLKPQSCNITLHCEICEREIPPHEEYYDVQVCHGSSQVCSDHSPEEVFDWTGEDDE